MTKIIDFTDRRPHGIRFTSDAASARRHFLTRLEEAGLLGYVDTRTDSNSVAISFRRECANAFAPDGDTTGLCHLLDLDTALRPGDLKREILAAMLAAPCPLEFPSYEELAASIDVRVNIVTAARDTQLAFDTNGTERPTEYWRYDEERGFTVVPGKPLIAALERATQPDASGRLYSFSCYRATEYVIVLGIARLLAEVNPGLLERLQVQWETRSIMSGRFHNVFMRECGSMAEPLPLNYYVPGDRIWFRNPDERSSDIAGYEGSWVFYLGSGLFSNFWRRDRPYTLTRKCLEIYHWRHGIARRSGNEYMDEALVESRIQESLANPAEKAAILGMMQRLRAPKGADGEGGCLDASREFPRLVCRGTSDIVLPDVIYEPSIRGFAR